nr:39k/pp31 [Helicoverpa armigera nucleopolyhedrovirus]
MTSIPAESLIIKLENSVYNKTHIETLVNVINLFEKQKIGYQVHVMPTIADDKKLSKKIKKITSNNKYILFNTFISKIKQSGWPSSSHLWNLVKVHNQSDAFLHIFDYMEKIGKAIIIKKQQISPTPTTNDTNNNNTTDLLTKSNKTSTVNVKKSDLNLDEIKESNEKRSKVYTEFNNILIYTYTNNKAPATSIIYDSKLTRNVLENAVSQFKKFLHTALNTSVSNVTIATKESVVTTAANKTNDNDKNEEVGKRLRKRKEPKRHQAPSVSSSAPVSKKAKYQHQPQQQQPLQIHPMSPAMVSDTCDDSQMSA